MQKPLRNIFSDVLGIPIDSVTSNLIYNTIPEWDSISHMALAAAIDDEYNITLDTNDIIDMSSFQKAIEILAKYNVIQTC